MQEVVAAGEMRLIAHFVHAGIGHIPFLAIPEDAGAVDRIAIVAADHDAILDGRSDLLKHAIHCLLGNKAGGRFRGNHAGAILKAHGCRRRLGKKKGERYQNERFGRQAGVHSA
jgi:hypothetical protein